MRTGIQVAREACEALGARQAVVVAVWADGRTVTASYGETKRECRAVRPLCDAIADGLASGTLPSPRDGL